jgi:nucleoside-triphosphatase
MNTSTLIIVTGDRGAGKTTFCTRLIELARSRGRSIGGVLSPAVFEQGEKIGIDTIDLRTRERRRLADRFDPPHSGPNTQRWSFHADMIEWGNTVLQSATPCDVLIVDELGTLEFDRGEGWLAGLNAIGAGDYRLGVVVIRPELLAVAQRRWPHAQVAEITDVAQAQRKAQAVLALFGKGSLR